MHRTPIKDLSPALHEKEVFLQGWAHEVRDLSKVKFILLRDWTGITQLVAKPELGNTFDSFGKIPLESVISVQGVVHKNKEARQGYEVIVKTFSVETKAAKLPIQVFEKDKTIQTDLSTRFDHRCIDLRKPEVLAVFKIQARLVEGMEAYLLKKGFLKVFTPCIMGVPSESGADVFTIDYYGKPAFLRQDPQLHRELAILGGIEKLYDLGPNWRAEKSHTTRHLCEHRAIAPEMAFINDEYDVMKVEEEMIAASITHAATESAADFATLKITPVIPKTPFPVLEFPHVWDILKELGKKIKQDEDLDNDAMKLLADYVKKKYQSDFYFINKFPSAIKPFYVMYDNKNPQFARSVDLNFRELELSSGGQREHRYETLVAQIKQKGLNPEKLQWFIDHFKYGAPPMGGYAVGIERITQAVLHMPNIKECCLFPRDPERVVP